MIFKVIDYKEHSWNKDYSKCEVIATLNQEPEQVFEINGKIYSKSIISYKDTPIIFAKEFTFFEEPEEQSDYEDFICPYCGYHEQDSWECDKDEELDIECSRCGKEYTAIAEISITYNTYPKDSE